jgi:hypothetical protein
MSVQFISSQGLADTLHNASGVVESWDIVQYDTVLESSKPQASKRQSIFRRSSRQRDMRDMTDLPGEPGSKDRISALAQYYADMVNAGEFGQSPFRDSPERIDDVYDISPARLGFFKSTNDADSSGNDLGDNVTM